MRPFLISFALAVVLGTLGLSHLYASAQSDAHDAALAQLDAGPAAAPAVSPASTPTTAPAPPTVHDVTAEPAKYLDDWRAARKIGWPLAVLVGLLGALWGLESFIPALRKGRTALYLAGGVTALLTACNAGLAGGTWWAMLTAAGGAALAYYQSHRGLAGTA